MRHEPIGVLKLRTVPGIFVDMELGVRDILDHVPGIDRRDHHIIDPVQNKRRLPNFAQVREGGANVQLSTTLADY